MKQKEEGLKRYVGVLGLSANIVNIIVGAGIFVIPAIVAENMGSTSIVAYLFCGFGQLVEIVSAAILLLYLGVVLSVIQLRRKSKATPDEFEIPGGYTVPILSAIIILYLLSHLTSTEKIGIVICVGILTIVYGLILYFKKKNDE